MTDRGYAEVIRRLNLCGYDLPDINEGREPDIEAAAKKAGVDLKTAKDLVKQVLGKIGR